MPNKPFEPTLTKAAVAKASQSKPTPTPPPLSDEDGSEAATGDVAGVPSSRVPAGERRRSRRLTEDLAAAAAAALAGSSGASGILDGGKRPAESDKAAAKADAGAHGDAKAEGSVPVARTSSDGKSAEPQTAPASGGRRRKAADADATTPPKARSTARSPRRSAQPGPSGKS